MKKVALVFVLAVLVPSLVLAWLAVRSLRDQEIVLERQQTLLYQGTADALAKQAETYLADRQHEFGQQVEAMLVKREPKQIATGFDEQLRRRWPSAEVGFAVTLTGDLLCPTTQARPQAVAFRTANGAFLSSCVSAEVFWNAKTAPNTGNNAKQIILNSQAANAPIQQAIPDPQNIQPADAIPSQANAPAQLAQANNLNGENNGFIDNGGNRFASKKGGFRSVVPQQQTIALPGDADGGNYSKVAPAEAEFRQLVGDSTEGSVARFVDNKLSLLLWYRSPSDPSVIFGTQLSLAQLKDGLKEIVQKMDPTLQGEVAAALLDDTAKPVAVSHAGFQANWKRPFVATEIGEALPHWEMAVYLVDPAKLTQSAQTLKLTLGLLIAVLLMAIAIGSWLIVADLNRQLTLARQKTDFVSNVSHELKTPLTSIRMFAELLAEGRVADADKQRSYLQIITAEAARLTRLINNVLDFSRLERGEKKYTMQKCDLGALVRETTETYRPHLESNGFTLQYEAPADAVFVNGDRDALAQVVVNLLSNAEKYSNSHKEITVQLERKNDPLPHAEVRVLDRGPGVPQGCEQKIFEKFYRAHDSLSSGIQGSGLGLTLARQIARTHGGDVTYSARPGGGSCFSLRLPLQGES